MMISVDDLLEKLKAAGEPTRLRLLALLRRNDLSVGELVQVLGQSQPRLSHHLKSLSEAGCTSVPKIIRSIFSFKAGSATPLRRPK
jgi:DNA-binding transcriptional ArsR family regulator